MIGLWFKNRPEHKNDYMKLKLTKLVLSYQKKLIQNLLVEKELVKNVVHEKLFLIKCLVKKSFWSKKFILNNILLTLLSTGGGSKCPRHLKMFVAATGAYKNDPDFFTFPIYLLTKDLTKNFEKKFGGPPVLAP